MWELEVGVGAGGEGEHWFVIITCGERADRKRRLQLPNIVSEHVREADSRRFIIAQKEPVMIADTLLHIQETAEERKR